MFPSRNGPTSSHQLGNQLSDEADASGNTPAAHKPANMVLAGGLNDVEEEVRGIGGGAGQISEFIHPIHVDEDASHRISDELRWGAVPAAGLIYDIAPSVRPVTEAATSDSGPSYTVPTLSINLDDIDFGNSNQRNRPSAFQNGQGALFPWCGEFVWENDVLLFGSKSLGFLSLIRAPASLTGPPLDLATIPPADSQLWSQVHSFDEDHQSNLEFNFSNITEGTGGWATNTKPADENSKAASTCFGSEFINLDEYIEYVPGSAQEAIAWEQHKDCLIRLLLDYYFRVFIPRQRGSGRQRAKSQQTYLADSSSKSSTRKGERSGKRTRGRPGRGRGQGGSQGGRKISTTDSESEDEPYFACPYFKRDPKRNRHTCLLIFSQISYVKNHLKRKHYIPHCGACYMVKVDPKAHECIASSAAPYGFITEEMWNDIHLREDRTKSHEKQWWRIYKLIFPNDKKCPSPYMDEGQRKFIAGLRAFIESAEVFSMAQQYVRDAGYSNEEETIMIQELLLPFTLSVVSAYASNKGLQPPPDDIGQLDHGDEQTAKTPYSNRLRDCSEVDEPMFTNDFGHAGGAAGDEDFTSEPIKLLMN